MPSILSVIFNPKVFFTLIVLAVLITAFILLRGDAADNTKKEDEGFTGDEGFRGSIKYSKYKR